MALFLFMSKTNLLTANCQREKLEKLKTRLEFQIQLLIKLHVSFRQLTLLNKTGNAARKSLPAL